MNIFKVNVASETSSRERLWTVKASTRLDAMQLAFALDGGWSRQQKDASGMSASAEMYCTVIAEEKSL